MYYSVLFSLAVVAASAAYYWRAPIQTKLNTYRTALHTRYVVKYVQPLQRFVLRSTHAAKHYATFLPIEIAVFSSYKNASYAILSEPLDRNRTALFETLLGLVSGEKVERRIHLRLPRVLVTAIGVRCVHVPTSSWRWMWFARLGLAFVLHARAKRDWSTNDCLAPLDSDVTDTQCANFAPYGCPTDPCQFPSNLATSLSYEVWDASTDLSRKTHVLVWINHVTTRVQVFAVTAEQRLYLGRVAKHLAWVVTCAAALRYDEAATSHIVKEYFSSTAAVGATVESVNAVIRGSIGNHLAFKDRKVGNSQIRADVN
jgi:hypothetical protein